MTYEIEIIEPSVQKIIQELANLNLLKFRHKSKSVKKTKENHSPKEALEGWQENVNELRGAIKEGKPMRSAWAFIIGWTGKRSGMTIETTAYFEKQLKKNISDTDLDYFIKEINKI